jgi:hypothetical protein
LQIGWFSDLRRFHGGLATAFLNTATAESAFYVFGWENDDQYLTRRFFALINPALEAIQGFEGTGASTLSYSPRSD